MHGINRSRHLHLIESLLLLEGLLLEQGKQVTDADGREATDEPVIANYQMSFHAAAAYRTELQEIYSAYLVELSSLAETINKYDKLFHYVKVEYVSKKLKDLKRRDDLERERLARLKDNIHTAYGISK